MALPIETFSNRTGPHTFFKAAGHPLLVDDFASLIARVAGNGPIAVYDPHGHATTFRALHELGAWDIAGYFVQRLEDLGRDFSGHAARPVTELPACRASSVVVTAYDAGPLIDQIRHLAPAGADLVSLDTVRLPRHMLSNPRRYLDPLNFATNFAWFRDEAGHHTRLVTTNYWHGYGARNSWYWLRLFDSEGRELATWNETLAAAAGSFVLDSRELRRRFALADFTGSLFLHAVNTAAHETVKYALDSWADDPRQLSCTHDANAYPSDLYAGLPAPEPGERVLLWVQNSHPCPIPAGSVALNVMGSDDVRRWPGAVPGFGTVAIDVAELFPDCAWPRQYEVRAGRHFVRPRYECLPADGKRHAVPRRIAHVNVERDDLEPDEALPTLGDRIGKGFILPFPVFPTRSYENLVLPTPMATWQDDQPLALRVYDSRGLEVARESLGRLPRAREALREIGALAGPALEHEHGHLELIYDFSLGGAGDGWLHGLYRVRHKASGHAADTSFGSHLFNLPVTWKREPQSYRGRPPGLSTRLFLRLGGSRWDTHCHLIYPASADWHALSSSELILYGGDGREVTRVSFAIPVSGSLHWRASEAFEADALAAAGEHAYAILRDRTCRLFGYHGLLARQGAAFSLDHMFGF